MIRFDIELSVGDVDEATLECLLDILPATFYVEDRSELGWGWVIRPESIVGESESEVLGNFVRGLDDVRVHDVLPPGGVLRLAMFKDTINCTAIVHELSFLARNNVSLEISFYPSQFDDAPDGHDFPNASSGS
jgi:hypothetical protein